MHPLIHLFFYLCVEFFPTSCQDPRNPYLSPCMSKVFWLRQNHSIINIAFFKYNHIHGTIPSPSSISLCLTDTHSTRPYHQILRPIIFAPPPPPPPRPTCTNFLHSFLHAFKHVTHLPECEARPRTPDPNTHLDPLWFPKAC